MKDKTAGEDKMDYKIKARVPKADRAKKRMPMNGVAFKRLLIESAAQAQKEGK